MNIAILDDYQDAVRHLACFALLNGLNVKVFQHGSKGVGQLAIRLADFDVLVLNRERLDYWVAKGAQPSETVRSFLKKKPAAAPAQA